MKRVEIRLLTTLLLFSLVIFSKEFGSVLKSNKQYLKQKEKNEIKVDGWGNEAYAKYGDENTILNSNSEHKETIHNIGIGNLNKYDTKNLRHAETEPSCIKGDSVNGKCEEEAVGKPEYPIGQNKELILFKGAKHNKRTMESGDRDTEFGKPENAVLQKIDKRKLQKKLFDKVKVFGVIIMITADGKIYGLDRATGTILWTQSEEAARLGPIVFTKNEHYKNTTDYNVVDEENWEMNQELEWVSNHGLLERVRKMPKKQGVSSTDKSVAEEDWYLAEPGDEGRIYMINESKKLIKLPITVKELVRMSPVKTQRKMYFGTKSTRFVNIDVTTGGINSIFESNEGGKVTQMLLDTNVNQKYEIQLGESQYRVKIFEEATNKERVSKSYRGTKLLWELGYREVDVDRWDGFLEAAMMTAEVRNTEGREKKEGKGKRKGSGSGSREGKDEGEKDGKDLGVMPTRILMTTDGAVALTNAETGEYIWTRNLGMAVVNVFDLFQVPKLLLVGDQETQINIFKNDGETGGDVGRELEEWVLVPHKRQLRPIAQGHRLSIQQKYIKSFMNEEGDDNRGKNNDVSVQKLGPYIGKNPWAANSGRAGKPQVGNEDSGEENCQAGSKCWAAFVGKMNNTLFVISRENFSVVRKIAVEEELEINESGGDSGKELQLSRQVERGYPWNLVGNYELNDVGGGVNTDEALQFELKKENGGARNELAVFRSGYEKWYEDWYSNVIEKELPYCPEDTYEYLVPGFEKNRGNVTNKSYGMNISKETERNKWQRHGSRSGNGNGNGNGGRMWNTRVAIAEALLGIVICSLYLLSTNLYSTEKNEDVSIIVPGYYSLDEMWWGDVESIDEESQLVVTETTYGGQNEQQREKKTNKEKKEEEEEEEEEEKSGEIANKRVKDNVMSKLEITQTILGYGSHGTVVYLGKFEGKPVAVKRLLIDFYGSAKLEIQALQEVDAHPNVIRYYCSEVQGSFLHIALELCIGSLHDAISLVAHEQQSLESPLAKLYKSLKPRDVLLQISNGLHHLHNLKLVHRDIKPQNILISLPPQQQKKLFEENEVTPEIQKAAKILISDFGLSRMLKEDESSFLNTMLTGYGMSRHDGMDRSGNNNNDGNGGFIIGPIGGGAGTVGWRAPECLDRNNTMLYPLLKDPAYIEGSFRSLRSKEIASLNPDQQPQGVGEPLILDNEDFNNNPVIFNSNTSNLPTTEEEKGVRRMTKKIDVFSLGCVFYYLLTLGGHPFGERYAREIRILRNEYDLSHLGSKIGRGYDEGMVEAKDLIAHMIQQDPKFRPSVKSVLVHPYFWPSSAKIMFIMDVSDKLESYARIFKNSININTTNSNNPIEKNNNQYQNSSISSYNNNSNTKNSTQQSLNKATPHSRGNSKAKSEKAQNNNNSKPKGKGKAKGKSSTKTKSKAPDAAASKSKNMFELLNEQVEDEDVADNDPDGSDNSTQNETVQNKSGCVDQPTDQDLLQPTATEDSQESSVGFQPGPEFIEKTDSLVQESSSTVQLENHNRNACETISASESAKDTEMVREIEAENAVSTAIKLLLEFEKGSEFVLGYTTPLTAENYHDNFNTFGRRQQQQQQRSELNGNSTNGNNTGTTTGGSSGGGGGGSWVRRLDKNLRADIVKTIRRNKKHHYQDLEPELKASLGELPDGFWQYFESRYPNLLLHCYYFVLDNKPMWSDGVFRPYFDPSITKMY
ncbi:Serine/threonine-protein kinase/endoribonuclease IRE1 [Zancudomyces culisetae]|uniref:non-specific serine/threonine protein kinase n=1 Tax=Zancudomyces culisetae TaxID=1213189 RepID=A0A1R1PR97_ZANCU|nr:Serine/threonine-protein kinase/endoribonuclease IRE1 [Zancudomyces culisetae]|eukprot:OMH83412.1 Serine/threonine-protein kinase/endoribonuclease IRE1 [Zancudomyces culisetae]